MLVEWVVTAEEKAKDCYDPYQSFNLVEHLWLIIRRCMGSCSYEWVLSSKFVWPTRNQSSPDVATETCLAFSDSDNWLCDWVVSDTD